MKYKTFWLAAMLAPMFIGFNASAADKMAAAMSHTVFVDQGSVFAMGDNAYNEILPGTVVGPAKFSSTFNKPTFTGVNNVKAVAASLNRTAAIHNDGTVTIWGMSPMYAVFKAGPKMTYSVAGGITDVTLDMTNLYYISNGIVYKWDFKATAVPMSTVADGNAVSLASGSSHIVVKFSDGSVGVAGSNSYGQLGNGVISATVQATVKKVAGVTGVASIAVGDTTSFAVLNNGTVMAWGENDAYHLGNGKKTPVLKPTLVAGLVGVKKIAANEFGTLALMTNGTVKAAGYHDFIGYKVYNTSKTFVDLTELVGVVDAFAGGEQNFVDYGMTGVVRGWMGNNNGKLGDGTIVERHSPTYAYFTPIAPVAPVVAPVVNLGTSPFGSSKPYCSMKECIADGNTSAMCQKQVVADDRGNSDCKMVLITTTKK